MSEPRLFECQKCGECCYGYGGTFLTDADINAIAAYIRTDSASFKADYCAWSGGRPMLDQRPDGYCIFWDKICNIHAVKPRMCKTWPFIKSVLINVRNWHKMASICPGMRTDVPDNVILRQVRRNLKHSI